MALVLISIKCQFEFDQSKGQAKIDKITDEDFQTAVQELFNEDDNYTDDIDSLAGSFLAISAFEDLENFTGLRRRIECARIINGLKRFIFRAITTLRNSYLIDVNDLYEDYKADTSDNGIQRLANRSRARGAFRAHARSAKRELRE